MKLATLCYVTDGEKTLMLYRNKKENDYHEGKWNGLGGKFEAGESPEECAIREIKEESGITPEAKDVNWAGTIDIIRPGATSELFVYVWDTKGEIPITPSNDEFVSFAWQEVGGIYKTQTPELSVPYVDILEPDRHWLTHLLLSREIREINLRKPIEGFVRATKDFKLRRRVGDSTSKFWIAKTENPRR